MEEKEVRAWRDVITTNTVSVIALVKVLTGKGIITDAEILSAVEETRKELSTQSPGEKKE
jgi:hypothetical protein